MSWAITPLDSLAEFIGRGRSPEYDDESTLPVLNQACIQHGHLDLSKLKFISEAHFGGLETTRKTRRGDIFVNSTGTGTLGRVAYWNDDTEMAFDGHVTLVRLRPGHDSRFFYYWLQMPEAQSQILNDCISGSTNQIELSREAFRKIRVRFPSKRDEQTAIADILATVDRAIEQTEALIAKQRRIKAGLLHDLLTRGIDEHGQLRDPSTHRFKPSPVGLVPEEWEVVQFDDLIALAIDGPFGSNLKTEHYVQDNGVRVVRLQNIGAGEFQDGDKAYVSRQHAQRLYRHEVLPGDLLVAALGDSNHPIGRACLFPNGFPPAVNKADCFRIRLKPTLALHDFVMCVLNSLIVRTQIEGLGQGVTRDRVNLAKMRSLVLPRPPLVEQQRIQSSMIPQDDLVIALAAQLEKYRRLKMGLMQDLLSGRVSVGALAQASGQSQ